MKRMKIISALLSAAVLAACLSSCTPNTGKEDESETYHFDSPNKAFEAMTDAVENGDYAAALDIYKNGAADADDYLLLNQYYNFSFAASDYTSKGCIGYPLDILSNKIDPNFDPAQKIHSEMYFDTRRFDGVYENSDIYIYFSDGKIAASVGTQITESVICTDELVKIGGEYFWAKHNQNGADELLYKLTVEEGNLTVAATESNTSDMFSGTYTAIHAEFPAMYY